MGPDPSGGRMTTLENPTASGGTDRALPPTDDRRSRWLPWALGASAIAMTVAGVALGVGSTPTLFINEENYQNPGGPDAIAAILRQVGR